MCISICVVGLYLCLSLSLSLSLSHTHTHTHTFIHTAFGPSCINRVSVFEWDRKFKEGRESVRDDAR